MRYVTVHNGSYWFQIRVPERLRSRYGDLVRVKLQTQDRAVARPLSLRLAAEWLTRFSMNLAGEEFDVPSSVPEQTAAAGTTPTVSAGGRLMQAYEYWRAITPGRPERTALDFAATAERFDARVGKPLAAIGRVDVVAFRDSLLAEGLAPATVRKKLGFVSAMLQAQVDAGRLTINPARGLRVPRPRVAPLSRAEFSPEQLRAIFASPIYTHGRRPRGGGGEACAWLPVLGLATGARLEELCQLRVEDVVDGPGGSLILRIDDLAEGQRVKTASSRRLVPVHQDVIASGFADYLAARKRAADEWLFPDLVPDKLGSRGGNFSKWWGRYLRSGRGCGIGDRRVVFRSFRHTFKSLCHAVMPEELHDRLTGHASRQHRPRLWLRVHRSPRRSGPAHPLPGQAARDPGEVSRAPPHTVRAIPEPVDRRLVRLRPAMTASKRLDTLSFHHTPRQSQTIKRRGARFRGPLQCRRTTGWRRALIRDDFPNEAPSQSGAAVRCHRRNAMCNSNARVALPQ